MAAGPRDRRTTVKERVNPSFPVQPLNFNVQFAFDAQHEFPTVDLYWDDPALLPNNNDFEILGVNIYRSFDSEFGPFERLNVNPIGATYYRDETTQQDVVGEDVSGSFVSRGDEADNWTFKTANFPIIKPGFPRTFADSPDDVVVTIDGQQVRPAKVYGETGEIVLQTAYTIDPRTNERFEPVLPFPDSTVTVDYTYNSNRLQFDLFKRAFWRVTTVGIDSWDGDTKETPLQWTQSRHIHQMENLDYIWREAIRRNRWMIDQGGERVKMFIHKYQGVPCGCRNQYNDPHPRNNCHTCFPPGTLVRAERGYVPIEEVQIGERVLTHDGTYQRVLATMETPYEGDLSVIHSGVSSDAIYATADHPFWVLRGAHDKTGGCGPKCDAYIARGDGRGRAYDVRELPSGKYHARAQMHGGRGKGRCALGSFDTLNQARNAIDRYRHSFEPGHTLLWEDAANVNEGDWLVAQWPQDLILPASSKVSVPLCYRGESSSPGPSRKGPIEYELTQDFMWVVGLYLAEGCVGTRSIVFTLHEDELEYRQRVVQFFEAQGLTASVRQKKDTKAITVEIYSAMLSEWWSDWLGSSCYEKRIPRELMEASLPVLSSLFWGVYAGDGWKGGLEITQTSRHLALQLMEILHRMGKQPLCRHQRSFVPVEGTGNMRSLAYTVSWERDDFRHTNRKGRWAWSGHQLAQVKSVGTKTYKGLVYNLTVENNHTYVVDGVVVHNCFGTGILGGYEGPYEVLLAPPDTERMIRQTDRGRYEEMRYEVWTGPRPLLSQRDFFVKLNGDRYSVGPVRMPTNRGNMLQQHFTVNLLDKHDIRYQVPVTGTDTLAFPETRPWLWDDADDAVRYPMITDKTGDDCTDEPPDGIEERGRTPVYENINYGP